MEQVAVQAQVVTLPTKQAAQAMLDLTAQLKDTQVAQARNLVQVMVFMQAVVVVVQAK
jgi:hypothetical protein